MVFLLYILFLYRFVGCFFSISNWTGKSKKLIMTKKNKIWKFEHSFLISHVLQKHLVFENIFFSNIIAVELISIGWYNQWIVFLGEWFFVSITNFLGCVRWICNQLISRQTDQSAQWYWYFCVFETDKDSCLRIYAK